MSDNFAGWNQNQIRALEYCLTDSLPDVSGMEVMCIEDKGPNQWRVFYTFERMTGPCIQRQGSDYISGRQTENGFEDFAIV
jgi:hypothetical protein